MRLETCDRLCHYVAILISDFTWLRRKVTDENLRLVYGDLPKQQLALLRRKMWHHLLLMVCEIVHAPRKIHRSNWHQFFYMPYRCPVLSLMVDERPCVLVTGHYGNFEVAGHAIGMLGMPMTTMARPLDNPFVDKYVTDFRGEGGQDILPKEGSAHLVQELLEQGGVLALLADQHAGGKGVWVDFFHQPTSCHKALALFVLSSHAPMVVHYNRRLDRPLKYEMGVTGIADPAQLDDDIPPLHLQSVLDLTEWYNACLESAIRKSPEQYWWLHRRWREVPEKQRRRLEKRKQRKLEQVVVEEEAVSC